MPYKPDRYDRYNGQRRTGNNSTRSRQAISQRERIAQANRARLNRINAEKRRRARRRQAAARLFSFFVIVVIVITLSLFLWSKKDNIGSSLSAITGYFAGDDEGSKSRKDKKNPRETSEIEATDAKTKETQPHFGDDGHDFLLAPVVPLFMGEERAIVLIDPGHGGIDGGAPGYLDDGTQIKESDIVLELAFKLRGELEARNIEAYLVREDDSFHSLYSRVARASILSLDYMSAHQPELVSDRDYVNQMIEKLGVPIEINSDNRNSGGFGFMKGYGMSSEQMELLDLQQKCDNVIFVSLHCNSHDYDTTLHGMQAYYCHDDVVEENEAEGLRQQTEPADNSVYRGRDNERNKLLAQNVYDGTVGKAPFLAGTNAGKPVLAGNYAVLREHGLAGTLLELGYMSNSSDLQQLRDEQTQEKIATGISLGIEKYFLEIFSP